MYIILIVLVINALSFHAICLLVFSRHIHILVSFERTIPI